MWHTFPQDGSEIEAKLADGSTATVRYSGGAFLRADSGEAVPVAAWREERHLPTVGPRWDELRALLRGQTTPDLLSQLRTMERKDGRTLAPHYRELICDELQVRLTVAGTTTM